GDLARAVRQRGMRFGTYYSTGLDWTFRLVSEGDLVRDVMRSAAAGPEYPSYVHDHMRELIDRYRPDVLWADIGYPAGGAQAKLLEYYFDKVPDGVVNDRWGAVDTLGRMAEFPGVATALKWLARLLLAIDGDPLRDDPARIGFKTAEYDSLPGIAPFKWEATRGLGGSFAFNRAETAQDMLQAEDLVTFLVDTVAKNGNVLINVGPDSYGQIPAMQQAPLLGLGEWLAVNGEAIYGVRPWQRFGNERGRELRYTAGHNVLYAVVYGEVGERFSIERPGIEWSSIEVLGAQVTNIDVAADELQIQLLQPLNTPAAVVRFTL
ncbi:MAG: alpha-L-fucosidase, partial [Halioglobus sp.]|nr:alpha-L-fucosidase [Halioglobus sp.]